MFWRKKPELPWVDEYTGLGPEKHCLLRMAGLIEDWKWWAIVMHKNKVPFANAIHKTVNCLSPADVSDAVSAVEKEYGKSRRDLW